MKSNVEFTTDFNDSTLYHFAKKKKKICIYCVFNKIFDFNFKIKNFIFDAKFLSPINNFFN